jgi:hypothetical protein
MMMVVAVAVVVVTTTMMKATAHSFSVLALNLIDIFYCCIYLKILRRFLRFNFMFQSIMFSNVMFLVLVQTLGSW